MPGTFKLHYVVWDTSWEGPVDTKAIGGIKEDLQGGQIKMVGAVQKQGVRHHPA